MTSDERFGDRLKKQIQEIYSVASEKTEEYARIGKKRLDILSLSRDVAREKRALGDRVYDLSRREKSAPVLEDVTVRAILGRIESLEAEMKSREEEISRIRDEARNARTERRSEPAGPDASTPEKVDGTPAAAATTDERGGADSPPTDAK